MPQPNGLKEQGPPPFPRAPLAFAAPHSEAYQKGKRKNNAKRPHAHHGVPDAHPFQTDKSPVREPTRFRRDQSIPKCDPALEAEEKGSYFEKTLGENLTKIA
ncbi:hypothetical protein TNCT_326491 [Trichonephila clavata]|uniref:Uncharacterized protein n=1 Tax=Trichonephila clavata TaxID=2740835 RepID=A0A8X6JGH9_TRICU|nr:hypothetical protein TNCT_326491 [Trichonephila clavata]